MTLARLLDEQLDEADHVEIADHVESCVRCQERLKELTSDCSRFLDWDPIDHSSTDHWLTGDRAGSGSPGQQQFMPPFLEHSKPGTAFPGSSVTFTWTAGSGTGNALWLGTTGAGSSNLYQGGVHAMTSLTVNGLPINGVIIYARLYTSFNGVLGYIDYTYTAK